MNSNSEHIGKAANSLGENFLKSVLSFPSHNALFIHSKYYTYKQLFELVIGIYNEIPTDKLYEKIGVYCSDTVYDYACILAVNLYGAAYVPLNTKFPLEKNKSRIERSHLSLVLASIENKDTLLIAENVNVVQVNPDPVSGIITVFPIDGYQKISQPIAYVLFTSGSTGEAKGVPVSFENCFHFFEFFFKNYTFSSEDKFLQTYELTFDVSVFSFFMPLQAGACCYVVSNKGIKYLKMVQMLIDHSITVVSMVPSTLWYLKKYFNEINLPDLKYSFFSGDVLNHSIACEWKKCLPNGAIHNFYGPTETTIVCTRYVWEEKQSRQESMYDVVPLGKAFPGIEFIIVDELNTPTNEGELCFSGKQVIKQYLNNSNPNQFIVIAGKHYYKTGDRAFVNAEGNLIFKGRIDNQVKINGYRIELGEIEFQLEKISSSKCLVNAHKNKENLNELVAFVSSNKFSAKELKQLLSFILPEYMIPSKFIMVKSLPLTMNGKVDKTTLLTLV